MRPTNVCLLVMQLLFVLTNVAISQVNLTNANPSVIIDFSAATPATVGSNPASAFTGAGFEPGPASAGKLSSSAWAITGWSIGDLTFNGSRTTDDYARGATSSAITTGGIYAYTGAPGTVANPAIMFQPGSTDFTPGTITLQIQNQGSSNITSLNISYNIFIRNNEGWSNSFNFAHSANNTSFTSVDAVNYASPEAADAAGWVLVGSAPSRSTIINGLNIAPGAVYYLRWLSDDVFGSGSRDEFGLDDISVAATFSPTTWFVNDNSTTDDVYTTSTGSDANAGTASSPFATLSYALSVASAGDIIKVDAGLYTISSTIDINKAIAIKGVFAGVQGTPASRGTESILNDGRSAATNPGAFSISTSSPIEIDGFTFTGSRIVSGQPANANLQIRNNRFMLTAMPNANQTNMIFAAGCNITLTGNFIRTNGFNPTNSAVMQVAGGYAGSGSSDIMTITNNIFRGIASPAPYNNGNGQSTLQLNFSNVQGIVSGNTFDGVDIGIIVANNSGNLAIQNNVFTDIRRDASQDIPQGFYGAGILLFSPSYSGPVTISGNTFQNSDCGIRSANAGGTESGTNISISNNTFLTNLYDIVHRYPTGTLTLNSNNIFSGTSVAASSLTQLLAIEDKIVHKVDVASYGFVDIKAGNVFVTTFSFFTPGLTTTASIQRGVNVANNGDAIHVGPGVYGTPAGPEGAISVSKDNINLKSTDGAATTIIQGQGAPGGSGNALVYLNGSGNSFDGFTVDVSANTQANATEQHPLRISGDNNIVNNNIIIGKGGSQNGYGVMVSFVNNTGLVVPNANNSADNNQVMNNVVHDFLNGGILIGGSLLADQNVVSGNEVYNTVAGVFIDRANNTSINENIVYNNERYGIRVDGAIARPSSGTIISRNVVRNNGGLNIFNLGTSGTNDLGAGIYLNGASADVQNNFIRDNKRVNGSNEKAGILISNSTDGLISNPVITFNSLTGNDRSIFNANAGVGGMETILTSIGRTSTSSINAPCNWFGTVASGAIASSIAGNVIYSPYLLDGTDDQPSTPGFQTSASCGTINNLYVNDNNTTGDQYTTAVGDDNNPGTASAPFATIAKAVASASAGNTIYVDAGSYDEQVVVNKGVTIQGSTTSQSILSFNGTVAGKPTLFDISADGVTVDHMHFYVDLSKLKSAIIASAVGLDNIVITNNFIRGQGTPSSGTYGDRNAVSVNYGGNTNYRVASGGVNSVIFTGNTVAGTAPSSYFRSGISVDEGGGVFSNNILQTINHDVLVRFANNGNVTISNNQFQGGGVELAEHNSGSGTFSISNNSFVGPFANSSAPGTAVLRIKNNNQMKPTMVGGNTFTDNEWAVSIENYNSITLDNNSFTPLAGSTTFRHVVFNTKAITTVSNSTAQTTSGGTFTNNTFNGSGSLGGTAISFLNHDNDNATFGTFVLGSAGNENNFNGDLAHVIYLDGQTGASSGATFPNYTSLIGAGAGAITTMACWPSNIDATNNLFNGVSGATATLDQNFALEDKIMHKTDNSCLGFVRVKPAEVFVTINSGSIQRGIDAASNGDILNVNAGTYNEGSGAGATKQVTIGKDLSIVGYDMATTIVKPTGPTTGSGDGRGWFYVSGAFTVNISHLTFDGAGFNIAQAIRHKGGGTINSTLIKNIKFSTYLGTGIAAPAVVAGKPLHVTNSVFENIERIGFNTFNDGTYVGNTYTGKGAGNWIDYAVDMGNNANVQILNNTISNNTGVATTDGSTSAGVLVSSFFTTSGPAPTAAINNNLFIDNTTGIYVGFNNADISEVTAHYNSFTGNEKAIVSTGPSVDATCNWYGTVGAGAVASSVSGNVIYSPYLLDGTDDQPSTPGFQTSASCGTINNLYVNDNNTTGDQYTTAVGDDNNPGTASAPFATIAKAVASASAGNTIYVDAGSYDEQVVVNKGVTIQGSTTSQSILSFNGTVAGKPTLFDISADGVTVDHMHFYVDLSKLKSAIIASAVGLDNIVITNNFIRGQGTPSSGTYGDRNAVSVNYGGNTNYRVASGGVNSVIFTGNTVAGTAPSSYFRSGISVDEGGGVFSNNILQTINHDVLVRFANNGNVTISNNQFQGGGVELAEHNSGSGTFSISNNSFVGPFANSSAPGTAVLRIKNNNQMKPTMVGGNTFTDNEWAVSIENYNSITLDNNSFTPLAGSTTFRHVVFNTKAITTVSNSTAQTTSGGTFTNNTFNGSGSLGGTAISFLNHDNDNATFGTFVLGSAGNENNFNGDLAHVIYLDGQTGASSGATFPNYTSLIGAGAGAITTMACWPSNIDATNNLFNGVSGATATLDQNFALEDKIMHKTDNSCLGFVRVKPAEVFVTINSGSIQRGIDAASSGDKVNVGPGVFTEDVIVNKEVRIAGQGAGVTTVYPATSNPIGAGGTLGGTNIFLVQASNVTIDNLTADGDNPANGAGIDARNGIVTDFNTGDHTNLEVHHTTVQNIFFRGIYSAYGNNFGSTFNFHHNTVNNVQGVGIFNYGNSGIIANNTVSNTADAIATNHSTGTIISNNTVSGSGIHTDNNGGGGGTADEIRGNTVSDIDGGGYGIMVFLPFRDVIVDQNIITNADIAIGNFGQGSAVTPVFSRNTIDGLSKVNSTGVLQATSYPGFGSSNVAGSYINNFIRNNQQGFYFKHEAGRTSNVGAHENSITGNTTTAVIGVGPDGAGSFINDFTCNWYGGDDPVVTGGSITYQPILNSGTDNDGDASNGFQPVPGSCVMCGSDTEDPVIVVKSDPVIHLGPSGQYTLQASDVIQSLTDNCDADPDIQFSRSSFNCADINAGAGESFEAYSTTTNTGNQAWKGEMGMEFQVNIPEGISIKQLGVFDHGGNGINGAISGGIRVAVFNTSTQSIVPGLDVNISGTADGYTGNHRMKNITPVVLPPGNYVVVAKGYNSGEFNGNRIAPGLPVNGTDLNDGNGAITFVRSRYSDDNPAGFNYPTYSYEPSPNVFLAGTFLFEKVVTGTAKVTVTITATDSRGNSAQADVEVTVEDPNNYCAGDPCAGDNQAPAIVSKNVTVQLDVNGQATIQPSDVIQTLTDNCDATPNVQLSRSSFTCADINLGSGDNFQAYSTIATTGNQAFQGEMGMEFQVIAPQGITIKQLGAFDHQGNGITGSISGGVRVAIFDNATHTIIPGLDVNISGNGDAFTGSHRMKNITPVILLPGNYVLVAKGYHGGEMNGNRIQPGIPVNANDLNTGNGAISFTRSKYSDDNPGGFNYPSYNYDPSPNVFLAGTFQFEGEASGAGNVIVTITATDDAGNVTQKDVTVTIEDPDGNCSGDPCASDNKAPVIVSKNVTIQLDINGQASIQPSDVIQSLTDNCDGNPDVQLSRSSFSCADVNVGSGEAYQSYATTTTSGNQAFSGEMGMEFQVNAPQGITIKQLGAFDHQANGINGTISGGVRVAIFDAATHAIVPGLDVNIMGNADAYTGNHRMKNITPVILPPGNYVIVAKGYHGGEMNGNRIQPGIPVNAGDLNTGNGAISFIRSKYSEDNPNGFNYPAYNYDPSPNVFLAGTFQFEGEASGTGSVTVTITATDDAGNISQKNVTVTVEDPDGNCSGDPCANDTKAPVIVAKNVSVQLDVNGQATIQPSDVIQSLTDNCDANPNVQLSRNTFSCADINAGGGDTYQAYSTTATSGNQAFTGEMGMEFQVVGPQGITIKQLGAFDHNGDGIIGSIAGGVRVAIFDAATQSIVPGLDVNISGNSDAYTGSHRMKDIAPVILPPGNYVLVAKGYHSGEMNGNRVQHGIPVNAGDLNNGNGAISFVRSKYGQDNPSGFNYPAIDYNPSPNVFLAGTFLFEDEPSGAGSVTVTITATDDAGNISQKNATVTVEDPNGNCAAPVTRKSDMQASILPGSQAGMRMKVFPNPASRHFNVQLNNLNAPRVTIQVIALGGKVVEQKQVTLSGKTASVMVPFNMQTPTAGLYIIRVITDTEVYTQKLVIQQ